MILCDAGANTGFFGDLLEVEEEEDEDEEEEEEEGDF